MRKIVNNVRMVAIIRHNGRITNNPTSLLSQDNVTVRQSFAKLSCLSSRINNSLRLSTWLETSSHLWPSKVRQLLLSSPVFRKGRKGFSWPSSHYPYSYPCAFCFCERTVMRTGNSSGIYTVFFLEQIRVSTLAYGIFTSWAGSCRFAPVKVWCHPDLRKLIVVRWETFLLVGDAAQADGQASMPPTTMP